jgi:hypothetical protein
MSAVDSPGASTTAFELLFALRTLSPPASSAFLIALDLLALQRARHRGSQAPGQARRRIIKVDRTPYAVCRHRFHNDGAKPAPCRRRDGRPIAFDPAHGEGIALGHLPPDLDLARFCLERALFAGVSRKFVEDEPNGLGGSRA